MLLLCNCMNSRIRLSSEYVSKFLNEMSSGAAGKELLPQRPTYGAQVMVQSEEERLLRKQVRKEEKRIAKILGKVEPTAEEEGGEDFREAIQ